MPATTIWATRSGVLRPDPDAVARETLRVGGRDIPVLPLDAQAKELPGWLGQPHVVVALELDQMLGREGLIESLSFYHGDIDVISPLKGLPINNTRVTHFFSRDSSPCASTTISPGRGRSWSSAASTCGGLGSAAVHRAAAGAGRGQLKLVDGGR